MDIACSTKVNSLATTEERLANRVHECVAHAMAMLCENQNWVGLNLTLGEVRVRARYKV